MAGEVVVPDLERLVEGITDGATLAVFKEGVAMAATRALIRRGVRDLTLVTVPTSGFQAELLIAAGCVATVETSGVSLGEVGPAPAFARAVTSGRLGIRDSTCPAIYTALQAAEKGIPFMPIRGLIGSDVLAQRDDYRIIANPYAADEPIVAVPAIVPDIALFHAPRADAHGNVWVGRQGELKLLAHAARTTLVTVEEVVDGNLLEDDLLAPATIPALYVTAVAIAPRGSWPLGLEGCYEPELDHVAAYRRAAASADGLAAWLAAGGLGAPLAAE